MPATTETAIDRCVQAWRKALAAKRVTDPFDLYLPDQRYAGRAYRSAMPYLTPDPDAIDTFVACVTHGILLGAIEPPEASKLLYAVQIILGSLRNRQQSARSDSKSQSRSAATPTPSPSAGVSLNPLPGTDGERSSQLAAPQVPRSWPHRRC
jgi:hypothetical protein